MNLYRIGKTVLNLDRINGVVDHQVPADADGQAGRTVLRVMFDHSYIDLADKEAQVFRHWFRHAARTLDPHKDEAGVELISPDDQVRRTCAFLRDLIDRDRPRDRTMRHTVHRLEQLLDEFLTGELRPVRVKTFEKSFEEASQ
jgi:hypothetical protein